MVRDRGKGDEREIAFRRGSCARVWGRSCVLSLSKEIAAIRESSGDDALWGSLKRPQREGLPSSKIGILVENEIETTVVARTDERFVFAKNEGIERASIFRASNSNGYAILAALRLDSNNFCRDGFHGCFLCLTSPQMGPVFKASGTERHQRRSESGRDSHRLPMKSNFFARGILL